jgi:hypothetical protein
MRRKKRTLERVRKVGKKGRKAKGEQNQRLERKQKKKQGKVPPTRAAVFPQKGRKEINLFDKSHQSLNSPGLSVPNL